MHLNSFYSHPVVAFVRLKVRMLILVQQGLIGFHNHFVNAKNALSCLRISSGIHVDACDMPIMDNDVVLRKVCCNSQSQDINSHAKIETSCYKMWNEVML